jgi:hypothetical protein
MRPRAHRAAGATLALLTTLAPVASAEPLPSLDLRGFQPPTDPKGSLYLEPITTPGHGNWNTAGLMSWAYRPAVLRDANGDVAAKLVSHQLSLDMLFGLGLGKRASVGAALPSVLYQNGESDARTARVTGDSALPAHALGDLGLTGKVTVVPHEEMGGVGLAALARVTVPTGDRASYLGEGALSSELRLLGELRLIAVSLQATAGFRLRTAERTFAGATWGNEIPWGVGVAVKPQAFGLDAAGRWTWVLETHGALPAGPEAPFSSAVLSPAQLGASARYAIRDLSLLGGVEGPLDRAAGVPVARVVAGVQWAPRVHDVDGDGVEDDLDECPELAEDRDGFEDADGCPDFDNDDDGVPDADDRCPTAMEDEDGFQDEDGCPDPDNDSDGIPDEQDACPDAAGPRSQDPKLNGCPVTDKDGDGVADDKDRCPDAPEDRDGFQDEDGCPDPDDDSDGIADALDRCPRQPGPASSNPRWNGCPIPDRDGDTFDDDSDKCPTEAETWNGVKDDDGCPDPGGQPLVQVQQTKTGPALAVRAPIRFKGPAESPELDPKSVSTVRAVAAELNGHPSWVVAVGARPEPAHGVLASTHALSRAFAVVTALRNFTFRDGVAETIGWNAVLDQPGAKESGLGLLVLGGEAQPAAPAPAGAKPAAAAPKPAAAAPKPAAAAPKPAAAAPKPGPPKPAAPAKKP